MSDEGIIRRLKNKTMYAVRTADPKITLLLKENTLLEWPVGSGTAISVARLFQIQEKDRHAKDRPTPDGAA